ncbi:hypothetical protein RSOL_091560 [Rhizoctonia solani AG-3 Rhs1AP]|uniref:Uncharacterized protein n=1 Tax=Rhizoctonia solani AG-3 Rhs1AP TaxID=1086054 RepID=X8J1I1_9AGAM|nr:hypothetical protein RSOL_091560 [Rhizoctonia solani AG-3 Rhs1AP]
MYPAATQSRLKLGTKSGTKALQILLLNDRWNGLPRAVRRLLEMNMGHMTMIKSPPGARYRKTNSKKSRSTRVGCLISLSSSVVRNSRPGPTFQLLPLL